jgi:fumarate reductase flavoprotein subunit
MAFDLVVIGGGFAGLTVANRAAELGLVPVVLEAGADALYPCNSRYSTGAFHVAFRPPTTPPDGLAAAIVDGAGGAARPDLARAVADRAADALGWAKAQGAAFEDHPRRSDHMPMMAPLREMRAGLDWEGSGANRLLQRLETLLAERGGALRRGVRATRIVMEAGAAAGVEAETETGSETLRAAAVVIADGGFQADPALVRAHIGCDIGALQRRNAGTGRGDGLRMAVAAGAATTGLEAFYGHVLSRDALTNPLLWPYPQVDVISASGIVVDRAGNRFTDEGRGGIAIANAIARLSDPLGAASVFDARVWEDAKTTDNVPPNPALPDAGGTVIEAPTLGALAEAAGIDRAGLAATAAAFNRAVADGAEAGLKPARTTAVYRAVALAEPPFYAIPVCAGITVTSGGISVDGAARVLDMRDRPIPGLYAAGSTVGGLEGGPHAAYVGGLIKSFAIGLIAADSIAAAR